MDSGIEHFNLDVIVSDKVNTHDAVQKVGNSSITDLYDIRIFNGLQADGK